MFSYTIWMLVNPTIGEFSFGTMLNERFLGKFCSKYDYFCAYLPHQNQVYSATAGTKKW